MVNVNEAPTSTNRDESLRRSPGHITSTALEVRAMAAPAGTERGYIRDARFAITIRQYTRNELNPHTPVAMLFASVLEQNRFHNIAGCETCYAQWKALT